MFLIIGFVSFGGGYAMLPMIEREVLIKGWLSVEEFSNVVAIAGMSPGPIATNSAIFVGYKVGGIAGAVAAGVGMVVPSLLLVLLIASFFFKVHHNKFVQAAFYGLRPIITGLIGYAAIRFAMNNHLLGGVNWDSISLFLIFAISLFALIKFKIHPLFVIVISGIVGVFIYG
ncbi:chromate transporter [Metabacillus malikii]|uniref:Chromate transporter n=2 Tax=Metabacillus malikii TaxID=1504265 RepID=A0ABT9ZHL9_9BACI|nr:chromate transporter [Metabacillus malikii]